MFIMVPFYQHGLSSIPAWIGNYVPSKLWDEITYPFLNCNSCAVEVFEWINNFIPHIVINVITYSCCRDFNGHGIAYTERGIWSFWRNCFFIYFFCNWWHRKLSKRQLPVAPLTKTSSTWHFRFSLYAGYTGVLYVEGFELPVPSHWEIIFENANMFYVS